MIPHKNILIACGGIVLVILASFVVIEINKRSTLSHGAKNIHNHGEMMAMMMVTSEKDFIEKMIPHHEEAVLTAQQVLARGGSTDAMRTLATNIITAQEKEIADMKSWYTEWYPNENISNTYVPMMRDLSTLSGKQLDTVFLEDMIMHHMGAIMMAQGVQPFITRPEINSLTQAIITTQAQEIEQMRALLKELGR